MALLEFATGLLYIGVSSGLQALNNYINECYVSYDAKQKGYLYYKDKKGREYLSENGHQCDVYSAIPGGKLLVVRDLITGRIIKDDAEKAYKDRVKSADTKTKNNKEEAKKGNLRAYWEAMPMGFEDEEIGNSNLGYLRSVYDDSILDHSKLELLKNITDVIRVYTLIDLNNNLIGIDFEIDNSLYDEYRSDIKNNMGWRIVELKKDFFGGNDYEIQKIKDIYKKGKQYDSYIKILKNKLIELKINNPQDIDSMIEEGLSIKNNKTILYCRNKINKFSEIENLRKQYKLNILRGRILSKDEEGRTSNDWKDYKGAPEWWVRSKQY